jgi:hypothetical protein
VERRRRGTTDSTHAGNAGNRRHRHTGRYRQRARDLPRASLGVFLPRASPTVVRPIGHGQARIPRSRPR